MITTRIFSRVILAVAMVAALSVPSSAVSYVAFEQITVAASAIGFTTSLIDISTHPQATMASCRLETAAVRFRIDGTDPTAAVGTLLNPGDVLTLSGNDLLRVFRAYRTTGTSGVLGCTYTAP